MMDFISFIEYAKVAYHLYLTEILTEYEMVEYLWDADAEVIQYSVDELIMNYSEKGDVLSSCITILPSLEVSIETNLDF